MQEYSFQEKHLGTDISISLITSSTEIANEIAKNSFQTIANYEQKFSRFIPTSELSKLNNKKELSVSEEFWLVLERSYELYLATNKIFNPLVQISQFGYNSDFNELSGEIKIPEDTSYDTDFDQVLMVKETRKVILKKDQQLDFGGILKGYLAEKISREIASNYQECTGNIVNLGGDLHTQGLDEDNKPFIFKLYNPVTQKEISIPLTNTSLATSGLYKRQWTTSDGTMNHILTPNGRSNPEAGVISASVVNKDGAVTEAYAKVLLISGINAFTSKLLAVDFKYYLVNTSGEIITNIL